MYLDDNILKILFKLDSDDISEEINGYWVACLQAGAEALVVFEAKNKSLDSNFQELKDAFENSLEAPNLDIESSIAYLDRLREVEEFNSIYSQYLDAINSKIISRGLELNPDTQEELEKYIKDLEDKALSDYIDAFVGSYVD